MDRRREKKRKKRKDWYRDDIIMPLMVEKSTFEPEGEHILNEFLSAKSATNKSRQMLIANQIITYGNFRRLNRKDVYTITCNIHVKGQNTTNLRYVPAKRHINAIEYIVYN